MRSAAARWVDRLRPEDCGVLVMAGAVGEALAAAIRAHRLPTVVAGLRREAPDPAGIEPLQGTLADSVEIHRDEVGHFDPSSMILRAILAAGRRKWIVWGGAADVGALAEAIGDDHELYFVFEGSTLRDGVGAWRDLEKLIEAGVIVCNWAAVEAQLSRGGDEERDLSRDGAAMRIGPGLDGVRRLRE